MNRMRGQGINFDTGFLSVGTSTREPFEEEVVKREMRIIRNDLHCNAVRITGGIPDRLEVAATHAAAAGLEVWFCPFISGLTQDELLGLLIDCAERAERLRRSGAEVVFVTGSELSLFTKGFFPGETLEERLAVIADPLRVRQVIPQIRERFGEFLRRAVGKVRARFAGKLSYASLPHEGVDWTLFDIIATDAGYRTKETAPHFRERIRAFVAQGKALGKQVAITEFGCPPYRGAAEAGGSELLMIEWENGRPARLKGDFVRDEEEQAAYIRELLEIFAAEGIDTAFVYTFARYDLPYSHDPAKDFDLASRGIVRVLEANHRSRDKRYPDMPWEPKQGFDSLANWFAK